MFELPEAKRVRREDLNNDRDSSWSGSGDEGIDLDLQARLNAQIAKSLGMDVHEPAPTASTPHARPHLALQNPTEATKEGDGKQKVQENSDEDLGEFDFRLFGTAGAPAKVVLEDDTGPLGEGALVHRRPPSYYLVRNVSDSKRREYLAAAVTGEEVVERSHWPAWGMELPWKVTRVTIVRRAKAEDNEKMEGVVTGQENAKTRKRPGKKRRIATRMKIKAKREKADTAAKKALDKEEYLKEKKKRLNRLKKIRKRAKKKAGKPDGEEDGQDDASSGSGGE
ncbi:DUF2011 domain protein [Metarhizium robertsii]|uniref:DUF2011 domain protein n=2 Tax=Metarhizium robertsii TaxID=568076 RepID=E9F4T8_METRA|nr:uncharacterized protein MAA_07287 [Metarhizium robertsii ARSEF 23]EFY97270.1 hypothetical protein MAA_07287 [Metarhizium robertsii ARSEF 23]EXV00742.1 DUF2011 domain protein [Metarhizium robertsii]